MNNTWVKLLFNWLGNAHLNSSFYQFSNKIFLTLQANFYRRRYEEKK